MADDKKPLTLPSVLISFGLDGKDISVTLLNWSAGIGMNTVDRALHLVQKEIMAAQARMVHQTTLETRKETENA